MFATLLKGEVLVEPNQLVCETCGGSRVIADSSSSWNPETQRWEHEDIFDEYYCYDCDELTTPVWTKDNKKT